MRHGVRHNRRHLLRNVLAAAAAVPLFGILVTMLRRVREQDRPATVAIPADVVTGLSVVGSAVVHRTAGGAVRALFSALHPPRLPDRSDRRRRGRVPVSRIPLPRRRHRGGRARDEAPARRFASNRIPRPAGGSPVPPDRRGPHPSSSFRWGTLGDFATAAFVARGRLRRGRGRAVRRRGRVRVDRRDRCSPTPRRPSSATCTTGPASSASC